jgi:DNA gyrase subunit A
MGRSAQGVRLLSIDKPDFVIGLDRIVKEDEAVNVDEAAGEAVDEAATDEAVTAEEPQNQLPFQDD